MEKKISIDKLAALRKLGVKTLLASAAVVLTMCLVLMLFLLGPAAFLPKHNVAEADLEARPSVSETVAFKENVPVQPAMAREIEIAPAEEAAAHINEPSLNREAVAATALDHYLQRIADNSLPYPEREKIAGEALAFFFSENAQVLIYNHGAQTGRESIKDYLDILLLQHYEVTINDKLANNEGKITQLSVTEQY
jgi:hypothetical protein